jgi:Outer membrane protein beta-barrel domain
MKNIFLLLIVPFSLFAQTNKELINPKGNWYFGAELGNNKITSFSMGEIDKSFQGGIVAEYYFARHWSIMGKIKYFETGVSFYKPNTHSGSWFDLGNDEFSGTFKGAEIALPIDIKWEFRLCKNLAGSLKLGYAYTIETKNEYSNYTQNLNPNNYSKEYGSLNIGYGFNYFINRKIAVYLDIEFYNGESKGYSEGFFGKTHYSTKNTLTSIGIKYNFKKII